MSLHNADAGTDRQLRLRMTIALVFLVLFPFAFVYTFLYLANTVGLALLEWADGRPRHGEFYVDPILLTVAILGGLAVQYWVGPRTVLTSVRARRVGADAYPDLHATVTRLAAQTDVPAPELAVIRSDVPNAFAVAAGSRGTIAVTTGLLELLSEDELEAVLAHELAHLSNRDASLMTVAWLLPTITYYLAIVAFYVLYGMVRLLGASSSGTSSSGNRDGKGLAVAIVVITVCAVLTLAVSAMFWLGSVLLYRILSRYREYAADRAAATTTGSPAVLAGALEKIDGTMPTVPDCDLRKLDGGVEALYLAPLDTRSFDSKELISTDIFPETHPPTEERIDRLRELARGEGGE
ncbi:M48 family metalloprotease [Halobacteria archaeon AArc-m2/3/4]|uniref:Protease HtpX homolog n=1 Tax=Natronoglomus mannanivorans TaxID=2979990 RepID=A0AAP2Z278_9EURY|nr:M48 family metalloprotease [Halobacteria archaeon AArc-xg1-1]MCU4974378.1 M48 family metalloprotease [Halobacteria archaeon AArc-m2/3/4]